MNEIAIKKILKQDKALKNNPPRRVVLALGRLEGQANYA
jgi:hypothetical protein